MKHLYYLLLTVITLSTVPYKILQAQHLNFAITEYYLSPDASTTPGTVLTASGTTLAGFNYSYASPSHPIFTKGVYLPVTDCTGKNLWIRFQHIAADPNGTQNGYNVTQTTGTMLTSPGGGIPDIMLGGWSGFLYDIQIFIDQNATGTRSNILGTHYPTNITVESLETLYNNGNESEWLSFIIKNSGSSGWHLNSINFTGINPNSNPGFSSTPAYTGTGNCCPSAFTNNFPYGSDTIYAISLSFSPNHSEFRMSAGGVSHFTYGYDFFSFGYQGMGMIFGSAPTISASYNNLSCYGYSDGNIFLDVTGAAPLNILWSNGSTAEDLINISAGNYSVTITDAMGCSVSESFTITQPLSIDLAINTQPLSSTEVLLQASTNGIYAPYSYLWNNGSTTDNIIINSDGIYSVTVTDLWGCDYTAEINYTGFTSINAVTLKDNISIYPVPVSDLLYIETPHYNESWLSIRRIEGSEVLNISINDRLNAIDVSALPSGIYLLQYQSKELTSTSLLMKR